MQIHNVLLSVLVAGIALGADAPCAGKWKMNLAKSDFAETTITFASLPSGEWQSTAGGQTYKFKMDGKDYSDGLGNTAAWKSVDANTWQTTWKLNSKLLVTETLKLGADGNALTVATKGVKPNGEAIDESATLQRASGGPGLEGKWRTTSVKSSSPAVLELVPSGSDGLSLRVPAMGLACDGKVDGKDYPCSGPTVPPGWTVAMTKTGAHSLELVIKKDSKPFSKVRYTVAANGKYMTAIGGATATNERIKIVYDRQ